MNIKQIPVPNFRPGRRDKAGREYSPLFIVNHIMEGTLVGTRSWFGNPKSEVSAHFGVGRKGEIDQYVQIADTAWHTGSVRNPKFDTPYPAGVSPNLYTIGIEWEGRHTDQITEEQYQAGLWLHRELLKMLPASTLPLRQRIWGHFHFNSIDRPNCPGPNFPWERLFADLSAPPKATEPTNVVPTLVTLDGKPYPARIVGGVTELTLGTLVEMLGPDTSLPLRFLADVAGYDTHYNATTKLINLKKRR